MQNIVLGKLLTLRKILYILSLVVAFLLGDMSVTDFSKGREMTIAELSTFSDAYKVTYVVDGDTVHVVDEKGNKDIVRLLAVNTLEKNSLVPREKCLAKQETEFTKQNLLNKDVYLISDQSQPKRDKYQRLLVYVATTSTSTNYFYNDLLIQTGNAKVYKASPKALKYDEYVKLQINAQNRKLGMWNLENCNI